MQGYYQYPTIHRSLIVFCCEDDLWSVPVTGGRAHRLTSGGMVGRPWLSGNGTTIAFTSNKEGIQDLYVMDAEGGESKRLTYRGGNVEVLGWMADNRAILFSTDAFSPFPHESFVYSVSLDTGDIVKIPIGPASAISYAPDGASVLCRNMRDIALRKRNKSGAVGQIWTKRNAQVNWEQLKTLGGNAAHPIILGDRIYFVSDVEGEGALYSSTLDGLTLKKEASHDEFYIRFPSTDGQQIVYQAGGDIYLFNPCTTSGSTKVEIDLRSPRNGSKPRFLDASRWLEEQDINMAGDRVLVVARGKPFVFRPSEGPVRQLGMADGVRYRNSQFLHDDESVVVVSDEGGSSRLEVYHSETGSLQKRLGLPVGRPLRLQANPKEGKVAVENHQGDLFVVNLNAEVAEHIAHAQFTQFGGCDWSPDGRWLAYSVLHTAELATIFLYDTHTKQSYPVTDPHGFSRSPSFDPEGRYLYFLSSICDEVVYNTSGTELGFPLGLRPFAVSLRLGLPSPLTAEAWQFKEREDHDLLIDPEGIERRIVAIAAPLKRYRWVDALPEGTLLLLSYPPTQGRWWEDANEPTACIDTLKVSTGDSKNLIDKATEVSLSRSHSQVIFRVGGELRYGKDSAAKIDLKRVKLRVNPSVEWRQIFQETWKKQCDYYWSETMDGIHLPRVAARYEPLLDRIATRSELSDILRELQGELANGHAREYGGDYEQPVRCPQGTLGADLRYDPITDSYLIERIPRGDPWNARATSPLEAVGVSEGDRIVAIDGHRTTRAASPSQLLLNKAQTDVEIKIVSSISAAERIIVVRPLADERMLRYRDWVDANRKRVHEYSAGKVGYIHIPDMGTWGYEEFQRYFPHEVRHEGLIVDVRYNRGGHTSSMILDRLSRRELGYELGRWTGRRGYPPSAPGRLVVLINQFCGSDGEIFAHGFKLLKLGPVVGTRTWGGVVGLCRLDPLVDGGIVTQPENAMWFEDVGYGLEGYGVVPDIEVTISPDEAERGDDPQLRRGIEEAMQLCCTTCS